MHAQRSLDRMVERLCRLLGRYGRWSDWLDPLVSWVMPGTLAPMLLPGGAAVLPPIPRPILMPGPRSNDPGTYNENQALTAPSSPHAGASGDPRHSSRECSNPRYQGMHGRPCRYSGGSNDAGGRSEPITRCPMGTVPGLWWRWYVPGLGKNVYYVDCCGMPSLSRIWCNWAKEPNWCAGQGNNVYTCTLALFHDELHVGASGFADWQFHALVGPPAGTRAPYTP